jgi:uncharacterized RDD family membrane protein YckC
MRFFNRFTLQTPESVELELTLAGIGNRVYALVVDYIFLGLILTVLLVIGGIFLFAFFETTDSSQSVNLWIVAIQILIFFAVYVGYFVWFETVWQGQTPGKKAAKIRVLCDDGKPVGLQQSILRALLRPIDDTFFIGAFLIMLSRQEKRIGDWVGGTIVVQEDSSNTPVNFSLSKEAQILADKLLTEADFSKLSPEDFAVIREYLRRRDTMMAQARNEVCRKIAQAVREAIALEEIPEEVTANLFLEAVYLAYKETTSLE